MQFPAYVWLGPLAIHPHVLFETLGYLAGARVYAWLKGQQGDHVAPVDRWWIVVAGFFGAIAGSKLSVWASNPTEFLANWTNLFYLIGGKSIAGGLVGALLAIEATKKLLGIRQRTGDLFALPLVAGIAIGRIGCLLTGLSDHTHGIETSLPWAVDFGDGVLRHPAQLYEVLFLAVVLGPALMWLSRRPHQEGDVFKLFMVGYFGFRLLLEFIKPGDPIAGLVAIQWLALAVLAYYAVDAARAHSWRTQQAEVPADV